MRCWYEIAGPERGTVISSRVCFSRNLRGVPFPPKLNFRGKKAVLDQVQKTVFSEKSSIPRYFSFTELSGMKSGQLLALAERGVIPPDFVEQPDGRALLATEDESCSVMINGEDHFLIQVRQAGLALNEAYRRADKLDTILDESFSFAFDDQLGFLTRNPALLGTGMTVSFNLHLPALTETGAVARIASNLRPLGISLRSTLGFGARPRGAVCRLSNQMTLGISEQEAITNLCGIAGQIIAQERAERNKLARSISIQDTVGRSLGIFRSARLLSYDEFLNFASIVRFGIATGLVHEIGVETIDLLAMRAQPANLALAFGGGAQSPEEECAARAELVRKTLASPAKDP